MGEAKRRGSQAARIEDAKRREAISIEDAKRRLEIPDGAEFIGYVVHLPEPDEFLVSLDVTSGETRRVWSRGPGEAKRFPRLEVCEAARANCDGAVSAALFETDDQYFTAIVADTE